MASRWTSSLAEPHFQTAQSSCPSIIVVIQFPQPLGVSRIRLWEVIVRKLLRAVFLALALLLPSLPGFPWGYEGHQVIALIAMKYITADAQAKPPAPIDLTRGHLDLTLHLPIGSEPGQYEVEIAEQLEQPLVTARRPDRSPDLRPALPIGKSFTKFAPGAASR
jgi:hypothetical protein